jgi:hypothetical protein
LPRTRFTLPSGQRRRAALLRLRPCRCALSISGRPRPPSCCSREHPRTEASQGPTLSTFSLECDALCLGLPGSSRQTPLESGPDLRLWGCALGNRRAIVEYSKLQRHVEYEGHPKITLPARHIQSDGWNSLVSILRRCRGNCADSRLRNTTTSTAEATPSAAAARNDPTPIVLPAASALSTTGPRISSRSPFAPGRVAFARSPDARAARHPARRTARKGPASAHPFRRSQRIRFQLIPPRWVVEQIFSWLGQNRGMSKDYERLCASAEAIVYSAMVRLVFRRLARG